MKSWFNLYQVTGRPFSGPVRLKELEAYAELAGKVGALHVFMGQDAMPSLQLTTPAK